MTLIINSTVKVFQMQCSNIKKLENDRGLILERKYDLLVYKAEVLRRMSTGKQ